MLSIVRSLLALAPSLAVLGVAPIPTAAQEAWSSWRGPDGTGTAPAAKPPTKWSETENVRWKVALDGRGDGSPIVVGDQVIVLSAQPVGEPVEREDASDDGAGQERGGRGRGRGRDAGPLRKQRFLVTAYARGTGKPLWQHVAAEQLPHEGTHPDSTFASSSAVSDGEVLIASFGSNGLYALTLEGQPLWSVDLGDMSTRNGFGEGASPALADGTVVVPWDHEGPSFIVALDAKTGKEKWRRERDEPTGWATPVIVEVNGTKQVIANGTGAVRGYALETGELVWECGGMTANAIPTPIVRDGALYVTSGFRGAAFFAIDLAGAKGDLTDSEDTVFWRLDRDTPYVPSPLLVDDTLYFLKGNTGILTAVDRKTGATVFGPERMASVANVYASPVAANGKVYVVDREGTTEVLEHGPKYEVLATNVLDDAFDASPAIVEGELYLRGAEHLYCIAER